MMGNSDRFKITVRGLGGHASMPHQTIDAIVVANQIISALQTIVSRNVDPLASAVITIGKMEGGYRYNVVADQVTLEGTVRTFLDETKKQIKDRFHTVVTGVAQSMGAEVDIEYWDGYPATVNTPKWTKLVKQTAMDLFGSESVPTVNPCLGGEDFGRFLKQYEGVYYWLGSSIGKGQKPLHDPHFEINEEALSYGMKLMSQAAINTLTELNQKEEV
jgi:amidohydrolase